MLGNFSIGDYFRKEAVTWGYELLTDPKWFGFDVNKLYMTIYPADLETKDLWISLGVDPSHIIPTEEGNFWEIGEGPCGPCTEIYFDRGETYGDFGPEAIRDDIENDRYIEIWNIVFSQYNAIPGKKRSEYPELPNKNIDTGCGLERVACVLQGAKTNYETDLFMPIIRKIETICGLDYTGQMAFKVIADHIRTVTFAIADGAVLSNEGRGYVLRRLLRRAVKYGRKIGIEHPFMSDLVDVVIDIMGDFYPHLEDRVDIIKKIVSLEEGKFLETIALGEKRFEAIASQSEGKRISGSDAFLLYDTFGFPYELTQEYAEEIGYTVDKFGFDKEMEKQKERARNARKDLQSMKSQNEEYLEFFAKSEFVGYETTKISTKIIKIFPDGIVLEKTPFYATSGGQVSDTGTIGNNDFSLSVTDVSKLPNGQFIHAFDTIFGTPSEGTEVYAAIDETRREEIARHHSATHLLFKALRDVLGDHVSQQGSQVSEESLRFDFNHYEMPTDEEILKVESIVRKMISESHKAHTDIVTVEEAVKKGAIAEFGEKYGDNVRMVNLYYTLDLCGGTHVKDIADIGNFAIKSIFSIGSGIYRIEALADKAVSRLPEAYANIDIELMNIKDRIAEILKSAKSEGLNIEYVEPVFPQLEGGYRDILAKREEFRLMQEKIKEMDKEYQRLLYDKKAIDIAPYLKLAKNNRVVAEIKGASIDQLKQLADNLSNNLENGFVMLASLIDADKIMFVAKSKNKNLHAGNLVKKAAQICGGNGGGRPDFAQAGGKDAEKLAEALDEVRKALL